MIPPLSPDLPTSLRPFVSIAVTLALAGCAAPPAGGPSPAATPVPTAAYRPVTGDLRVPAVKQQLDEQLRERGWAVLGTTVASTGAEPAAHYFSTRDGMFQKTGDGIFRLTQLVVYPSQAAATQGVAATVMQNEYNCNERTMRTVSARSYADRALATAADKPLTIPTQSRPVVANTLADRSYKALCERSASGSGLLVGGARALTNAHVVNGCRKLEAVVAGQRYPARTTSQDARLDLALVELTGFTPATSRPLALRRVLSTGETVTVAGYPMGGTLGNDLNVQAGIVNTLAGLNNNLSHFQMSATVQPGNSGGPVFDRSGNLAGIVVQKGSSALAVTANTTNINIGIKPEMVRLFLSSNQVPLQDVDAGARLETEDVAARARDVTLKLECSMGLIG